MKKNVLIFTIVVFHCFITSIMARTIELAVDLPSVSHTYEEIMGMEFIEDLIPIPIPEFTASAGEIIVFDITFNNNEVISIDSNTYNSLGASMSVRFKASASTLESGGWGGSSDLAVSIELTNPVNIPSILEETTVTLMKTTLDGTDDYYIDSSYQPSYGSVGSQEGTTSFAGAKITLTAPTYFSRYMNPETFTISSQTYRDNEFQVFSSSMVTSDITILSIVSGCKSPVGDIDGDCKVNLVDLALFAGNWMVDCENNPEEAACQ